MIVICQNLFWRPVIQDRHRTPAPPDFGHVLQQGGPSGLASDPAQSLLDARLVAVVMFSPVSRASFRANRSVSRSLMLRAIPQGSSSRSGIFYLNFLQGAIRRRRAAYIQAGKASDATARRTRHRRAAVTCRHEPSVRSALFSEPQQSCRARRVRRAS
jgi:hypothetical protein